MRRRIFACLVLIGAAATAGADPYFLDRNGVLWTASAAPEGLVLTGVKDTVQVVRSVVAFPIALAGTTDTQIQVAADDLTGKVAVVWQRNWSDQASEIMLAVWHNGDWERVTSLTQDLMAHPRNPEIQLTQFSASVPDPAAPNDADKATLVQDSYLHAVWWEGTDTGHATYALLRLTADATDSDALTELNLDSLTPLGFGCANPAPPAVLEYPLFASQDTHDHALVFFGSQQLCQLQLVQVSFTVDTQPVTATTGGNMTAATQRRRSVPIFGVMKTFALTQDMSMDGTRVVLGANLNPVAYRVVGPAIQYVTYGDHGWSPARTLAVANGLTLDQAIPLVENLAR
jgi:hypothetical protein